MNEEKKNNNSLDKKIDKVLDNYGKDWEVEIKYLTGFNRAIIGLTPDHRVAYSRGKMIDQLMEDDDFTEEEAEEWIDYNTIRSLPYMGENAPIIVDISTEELLFSYDYDLEGETK